jgi:hypothetical protein
MLVNNRLSLYAIVGRGIAKGPQPATLHPAKSRVGVGVVEGVGVGLLGEGVAEGVEVTANTVGEAVGRATRVFVAGGS